MDPVQLGADLAVVLGSVRRLRHCAYTAVCWVNAAAADAAAVAAAAVVAVDAVRVIENRYELGLSESGSPAKISTSAAG